MSSNGPSARPPGPATPAGLSIKVLTNSAIFLSSQALFDWGGQLSPMKASFLLCNTAAPRQLIQFGAVPSATPTPPCKDASNRVSNLWTIHSSSVMLRPSLRQHTVANQGASMTREQNVRRLPRLALPLSLFLTLGLCAFTASAALAQTREDFEARDSKLNAARLSVIADRATTFAQERSIASPLVVTNIIFWREADGTISAVGEVSNPTSMTLTFNRITIGFYSGGTFLGSKETYAFAPMNVRLSPSLIYTAALPPGATGFFKAYTNIAYNSVTTYNTSTLAEATTTGRP